MSISRRMLRELAIPREAASQIMAAHRETVEALTRERDEALSQLSALPELECRLAEAESARNVAVSERDEIRAKWEAQRAELIAAEREADIIEELKVAGANPAVIPLLAQRLMSANATPGEAVQEATMLFPDLFAQPQVIGVPRISPPTEQAGPLTHKEISRMSEDEIIKRWRAVEGALSAGMRKE